MFIEWANTELTVHGFVKEQWPKGERVHPNWTGYVEHQQVWLALKGQGKIGTHHGYVPFRKGTVFWFKPGFCYQIQQVPSRPLHFYSLAFDLFNLEGNVLDRNLTLPPEVIKNVDFRCLKRLFEDILTVTPADEKAADVNPLKTIYTQKKPLFVTQLILMEIDEAASASPQNKQVDDAYDTKHDPIASIAYRLKHDPAYRPTVAALAKEAYMTYNSFFVAFKKRFGQSPKKYAIACRIDHASRLLVETDLKIREIADLLGYNDSQLFSKQFITIMHCPPGQFREHQRKDAAKRATSSKIQKNAAER